MHNQTKKNLGYALTLLLLSITLCIVTTDAFQRMLTKAHIENVLTKNLYFSTNLQILFLNRTNLLKHIVANEKKTQVIYDQAPLRRKQNF